ncbi:acyl transferase domain-containing protein [Phthorimaea operculella]|nr:acyl transferase domain-containing protein [Phthorimaea operculella]
MAPVPEEISGPMIPPSSSTSQANTVVISGMSGSFPRSRHISDFSETLYKKVDPVVNSELRWDFSHPEIPPFAGTVPDLDRFDAQFFKVSNQLAKSMDPMSRKIKEHVYSAIYDAGLSVDHLYGRKVGVFVGTSLSEAEKAFYYNMDSINPSSLQGCSRAMFANRISYWLNVTGPSLSIDDSCASSMVALEQAFQAIKRGECESAIVAGASITLHPHSMVHFGRIIKLCEDGKTKSFDQQADGCVKSEAISVLFLQKSQDALRIYAEVVNAKNECDFTSDGHTSNGFCRNPKQLADFVRRFYQETKISPRDVEYVEAFGSGDPVADKAELEAIQETFCEDRSGPVIIGSVTSNIGYTEAASGLCSVTKVLLGYHKGMMAANLHCSQPRQDVAALQDGRMRLATDHAPFGRTYASVNGLSATGINSHVLLRGNYIPKVSSFKSIMPRLVTISGRQASGVQAIIDDLSSRPIDAEEVALLHNIHEEKNSGHLGRGFAVLDTSENGETVCLASSVDDYDDMKRPVWFVYSGMGSQWAGMGKQLMRIPVFAAAIERCHKYLQPTGLDIVHIITSSDKKVFDNILHSFVGIAAVQIGLTDVLQSIGIVPDKIIGHSVGELGCGYTDGCLSDEEMILTAYSRGKASLEAKLIRGSMAAVGVGYQKVVKMCPADIDVACHNGPDSCTISGPADSMREFVAKLKAQGIFAKEVPCSNIAYHSRYITEVGSKLLEYLNEVIKSPKRRSERWLSTSVPQERWEEAQYCSPMYHTNNLLSPVLFEEVSRLVPAGAVVVEVAPHGLLQAILKRSLPADCRNIPLTKRDHPDNTLFFLQAIGQLYMQGCIPKLKNLYPKVKFPVSTETPGLSHLVEWNHSYTWILPTFKRIEKQSSTINSQLVSIHDPDCDYLRGNVVNGKNEYPFSAALVCVWDTFAMSSGVSRGELSVQFRDVQLFAQPLLFDKRSLQLKVTIQKASGAFEPLLFDKRSLQLKVTIQKASGAFEVVTPFSRVATGNISQYLETLPKYEFVACNEKTLGSGTIYKIFEEKQYSLSGDFCSIYKSNATFTEADLIWKNNWVTLIEGMLQLNALHRGHESASQPSYIHTLVVDVKTHGNYETAVDDMTVIPAVVKRALGYTRCGGILLKNVQFVDFPTLQSNDNMLQTVDHLDRECNISLQSKRIGDVKSLSWVNNNKMAAITSENIVTVHFAGISMYDVKVAMGVTSPERGYNKRNVYGMEFSGVLDNGERVMGLVRGGAASSHVTALPGLTWPVPQLWTLEDAATVPLAYAQAFYCLLWTLEDAATVPLAYAQAFYCLGIKAKLQPGMTILVHGGSGALGQAVISIALANHCKVLTTVADDNKKKFLMKLFPELTEDVIGCSRDDSFVEVVMAATNGEGCDIIVSCATGDLKNATLKCAAFCGITIDVAQTHSEDTFLYGMSFMTLQRSYAQVDFFSIFENEEFMKAVQIMLSEGIARGYVRPLTRLTYDASEVTRAVHLLASSRHRGRVLLRLPSHMQPSEVTRVPYDASEVTRAVHLLASSRHRGRVLLRLPSHMQPR